MSGEDDLFASTMALWRDQQNQMENSANWATAATEENASKKPSKTGSRVSRKLMIMFGLIIIVIALLLSATFISSKRQKNYTDSQIKSLINGTRVSITISFSYTNTPGWNPSVGSQKITD